MRLFRRASRANSRRPLTKRRLSIESLEHRNMLAVFTVSNLSDAQVTAAGDAPGTLRQAIFDANSAVGPDSIEFQSGITGTITLTAGELAIDDAVTIVGPGANLLTIDAIGNDLSTPGTKDGSGTRVLNVDDGIFSVAISVEIRGLTLTGGDASSDGGGILSKESLTLIETNIVNNSAFGAGVRGGGVFSEGGDLILFRSTIAGNLATGLNSKGGGVFSTTRLFGTQTTSITNSSLTGNTTSGDGGGLFTGNNLLESQVTRITNSTISGNVAAGTGGGVFAFDGNTTILYSTITDNTSMVDQGGGIASFGDGATLTTVSSSLISGNTSGGDLAVVSGINNSFQSDGYNLVGSGNVFGPANQFSALDSFTTLGDQSGVLDPRLGPLSNNGGITLTHPLLPTSSAIDAGDPTAVVNIGAIPEFDQRGTPFGRIEDGNGDSTARIDIGAFEISSAVANADFDADGDVDGSDFLAWQRGFGTLSGAERATGDANNDGAVNQIDLGVWEDLFGTTAVLLSVGSEIATLDTSTHVHASNHAQESEVDAAAIAGFQAQRETLDVPLQTGERESTLLPGGWLDHFEFESGTDEVRLPSPPVTRGLIAPRGDSFSLDDSHETENSPIPAVLVDLVFDQML